MKIAQIAPLFESVPPKFYGGTERVVYHLTEELVRQGHDVTLYASGDSQTSARLAPQCARALRLDSSCVDNIAPHVLLVENICRDAPRYDIIHTHIDYLPYPVLRRLNTPSVATLHGRLDIPDIAPLYREFSDIPLVSISDAQRAPLPWANWQRTVYHGIPENAFTFRREKGSYLAFLGRISREKRLDNAIAIARRVGMPLKIAAKVSDNEKEYFDRHIRPLLKQPQIEYLGEIGEAEKNDFLGNAYALLFPIDWPEPFGLVMIEAMACGTPVIAFPGGSVPEIIENGATGFVVNNIGEAAGAVRNIEKISRQACREAFEKRFTASRMAADYSGVYERIIKGRSWLT